MEIRDITLRVSDVDVAMVTDLVGEDGVMVLKLIGANSSELFVGDVVCGLVNLVRDEALVNTDQLGTIIQQSPVPGRSNMAESGL